MTSKMKIFFHKNIFLFLMLIVLLAGCSNQPMVQTQTASPEPSATPQVTLPPAISPEPTDTPVPTDPPTIEPTQRVEMVRDFLRTNGNCESPCLWGIQPGATKKQEVIVLLNSLLSYGNETEDENGQSQYRNIYEIDGDSINLTADFSGDLLTRLYMQYHNNARSPEIAENWTSFIPGQILNAYGKPDHIKFSFYDENGNLFYGMTFIYSDQNFSASYDYYIENGLSSNVCPNDQHDLQIFDMFLGQDLSKSKGWNSPNSVQDATGLTLDEFYEEMIASPEGVCFQVPAGLIEAGEE